MKKQKVNNIKRNIIIVIVINNNYDYNKEK